MSNHLNKSLSPYLLQHAQNPVDWYPWSDDAFEKAKRENKPVLVSIGYSACHWCHVMEHESFEDEQTAVYMNEHFVNIKVDREEHPEVDHFYMDALQAMTGGGGWPLNMFVTPDRKPFYGGTYFPSVAMANRSSWLQVLQAIHEAWTEKADEIEQQANQMIQHIKSAGLVNDQDQREFQKTEFQDLTQSILKQADTVYGGFGSAPKFPSTMAIQYLLDFYHFYQDQLESDLAKEALAQALLSLDKMIEGGIYDQLGGGFSRYATDRKWLVPHFEKMLYDNALLVSVFSNAYRITANEKYKEVIEETIDFCLNELSSEDPEEEGFYCALDADSEGVEGKFYVWTLEQFQQALPYAHPALAAYFGISKKGNWEGVNILHRALHRKELLVHFSLPLQEWYHILDEGKQQLLNSRNERVHPGLDDKMLLSWNALMTIALCNAGLAVKNERYLEKAGKQLDWLLASFRQDNELKHAYKNKHAYIAANLDDYSFLIKALLEYASATGKTHYISLADQYMNEAIQQFSNEEHCFFNFSSVDKKEIPVPKVDLYDGAIPSANSVLLECLYKLGNLKENRTFLDIGDLMLHHIWPTLKQYPLSFANWAIIAQWKMQGLKQLLIAGKDKDKALQQWQSHYFPQIFALTTDDSQESLPLFNNIVPNESLKVYLCSQWECSRPADSINEILTEIKKSAGNIV